MTYLHGYGEVLTQANGWDDKVLADLRAHPTFARLGQEMADQAFTRAQLVEASRVIPREWYASGAAVGTARQCAERLKDYPFTVDHVSRFRTPKEQKEVVAAFNEGKVDILIGTHRLLGRDMRGKDIGLIIVDEEQRFGVKQKELLRQLKLKVDVIAMSATPIPRTLQMSMAGIRDISVIETPPEGRRPVKTYVGEYDEELVKQAIMREKNRAA